MDTVEKKILERLTFAEPLEAILEEVDEEENIVTDVLKQLIRKGLVATVTDNQRHLAKQEIYYDSDHMDSYSYIITAKGLSSMGH